MKTLIFDAACLLVAMYLVFAMIADGAYVLTVVALYLVYRFATYARRSLAEYRATKTDS